MEGRRKNRMNFYIYKLLISNKMKKETILKFTKKFTKENVETLLWSVGVYKLVRKDAPVEKDRTLYIGKGKLRDRLLAHFTDGSDPIPGASHFEYIILGSESLSDKMESNLLFEYKQKYGCLPKYNERMEWA